MRESILIGPVCFSTMVAFTGAKSKDRKVLRNGGVSLRPW